MEFSLAQLNEIAHNVINAAAKRIDSRHATILAFSGDLGAGKTTMIKEIAKELGVLDDLASPTFVIYKIYKIGDGKPWKKLIHGDMYRLESEQEILQLGWEQLINDPDNLILIEWPEKINEVIPAWAGRIEIRHQNETTRSVDIIS